MQATNLLNQFATYENPAAKRFFVHVRILDETASVRKYKR
jgi:hypothetical protein